MEIYTRVVKITTTGADGVASGSEDLGGLRGYLLDVYLDYHASAPGTTDVTISYKTRGGTILTKANNATDVLAAPRRQVQGNDGANLSGEYEMYPIDQDVTIAVAQANALAPCVTVYLRMVN